MTPSIEERRETAERLREIPSKGFGLGMLCDAVNAEHEGETYSAFVHGFVNRLADLIEPLPERTCRVEYRYRDDEPWPYAACSECGAALSYYDTVDERGEESSDLCPFCPNCGARVVER